MTTDPRTLFEADFRAKMTEICRRGRLLSLDPADLVATIFRWIVETAPPESSNAVVRQALVEAIDAFVATRKEGSGVEPSGNAADFVLQGVEGRRRLLALLEAVPREYRVLTDDGATWTLVERHSLARHEALRRTTIHAALDGDHRCAEVGAVLLELSASIFRDAMTRETFLKNAALWYDSAAEAAAGEPTERPNAPGGSS